MRILAELTRSWAKANGFGIFAEAGYESQTVTCVANTRKIDVSALNKYLATRHMHLSDGYGALKARPSVSLTWQISPKPI